MPHPYRQPLPTWSANKWCFENGLADSPIEHGCCLTALHDLRSNYRERHAFTTICATTEGGQRCGIMYPESTPGRVDQIAGQVQSCSLKKLGKPQPTPKRKVRRH